MDVNMSNISVRKIPKAIDMAHQANIVPAFIGESGIGKTEVIRLFAKKRKFDLIELNCSTLFPEDFGAIRTKGDWTKFILNEIFNVDSPTLFFIDEFSRARGDLRNLIMSLVNERKIYGVHISDQIKFAVAMNPSTDEYGDTDDPFVDLATTRRYSLFSVRNAVEDWVGWAKRHRVSDKTISFIERNNVALISGQASPRQWVKLDSILKKYGPDGVKMFGEGTVGAIATPFLQFIMDIRAITAKDVMRNYPKFATQIKDNKSLQLSLGSEFKGKIFKKEHKRNMIMFFLDLQDELRYKIILDLMEGKNEKLVMSWVDSNEKLKEFMEEQSSY